MPCLNEEATLARCILKAAASIEKLQLSAEILIADNGSTDQSITIAESLGARVINVEEKGYGNALYAGIKSSRSKYIIMADSDDSYDFSNLDPFIKKLRDGYDLVIGNRFDGGIEEKAMPFLHRYLGNPVLSFLGRLFFKIPIRDFHCGLRGFNRVSILELDLCTPGMEFASEMIVKSALNDYKVTEVPTKLYKDGRSRRPHLNTWRDGWRHLYFLLMHSPKWLFLYPGLLFFMIGLISYGASLIGELHIGNTTLRLNSFVYLSFLIIVGFQSILFYFFSLLRKHFDGNNDDILTEIYHIIINRLYIYVLLGVMIFLGGVYILVNTGTFPGTVPKTINTIQLLKTLLSSIICTSFGIQIIFNSFFLGMISKR
ncbi:glycosyltransferase family 2 protein [Pedobacter suwonensis]